MDACDLCGKGFTRVDGSSGNGNEDSLMINNRITQTVWYKTKAPKEFKVKGPNPYTCRSCVNMLVEAGMKGYIGGNANRFLTVQEYWKEA